MANGGYLIKFDNKEIERCCSVTFDYDEWCYETNDRKGKKDLPFPLKKITLILEEPEK